MVERLIKKMSASGRLPSPVGAALRVLEMSHQEEVTLVEIAEVISTDPALAARILRFANSAFSGAGREIGSVRQAAMMLGIRTITTLSLGFSLVTEQTRHECAGFDYDRFWYLSLGCATFSEGLARTKSSVAPDEAFSAGLLANIGQLALASGCPDEYAEVIRDANGDMGRLLGGEQTAFGATHTELGASLLEGWNLPLDICEAVRSFRSTPDQVHEASALQATLYVADVLSRRLLQGDELEAGDLHESLKLVQRYYGVSEDQFMAFFEQANQERIHFSEILSVATGTILSAAELRAQAEKQMLQLSATSESAAESPTTGSPRREARPARKS